jgi:hypothetical protein
MMPRVVSGAATKPIVCAISGQPIWKPVNRSRLTVNVKHSSDLCVDGLDLIQLHLITNITKLLSKIILCRMVILILDGLADGNDDFLRVSPLREF